MNKTIWAIGDVHGCCDELVELLEQIEATTPKGGEIIFLGDYCDRGPKSKAVVDLVMRGARSPAFKFKAIAGNHEHMLLDAIKPDAYLNDVEHFIVNGGNATINSFAGEHYQAAWATQILQTYDEKKIKELAKEIRELFSPDVVTWIKGLPFYYEYPHHVFVHAGARPGIPMAEQDPYELIWMRRWETGDKVRVHGENQAVGSQEPVWDKHIVYGHTPRPEVFRLPHCTGLDTGAVFGNGLTAARFDRDTPGGPLEIITVPSGKYR